jgi:hypothetical protein
MSSLKWNTNIMEVPDLIRARLDDVVKRTMMTMAENIVVGGEHAPGTPVDTGFARGSWFMEFDGNGQPNTPPQPDREAGAIGRGPNTTEIFAQERVGGVMGLMSNCEYMGALEFGHSQKQAPQGMIRLTASAAQAIVDDAVRGR